MTQTQGDFKASHSVGGKSAALITDLINTSLPACDSNFPSQLWSFATLSP